MKRTALAVVPRPPDAAKEIAPRLTIEELAQKQSTSRWVIEKLVDAGMPCFDLSIPRPGCRRKRILRFDLAEVEQWLRGRR